jgi:hypothetical protein
MNLLVRDGILLQYDGRQLLAELLPLELPQEMKDWEGTKLLVERFGFELNQWNEGLFTTLAKSLKVDARRIEEKTLRKWMDVKHFIFFSFFFCQISQIRSFMCAADSI